MLEGANAATALVGAEVGELRVLRNVPSEA